MFSLAIREFEKRDKNGQKPTTNHNKFLEFINYDKKTQFKV